MVADIEEKNLHVSAMFNEDNTAGVRYPNCPLALQYAMQRVISQTWIKRIFAEQSDGTEHFFPENLRKCTKALFKIPMKKNLHTVILRAACFQVRDRFVDIHRF